MRKQYRFAVAAALSLLLVSAGALVGCLQQQPSSPDSPAQSDGGDGAEQHEAVELQIFAANSLSKALVEVQDLYTQDHDWVTFADTQFEGSGTLVESLDAGSYADLLITASKNTMDAAEEDKLVDMESRFDMFSNELVIVAREDFAASNVTLQDIADGTYSVALGDDAVPAGNYAAQALSTVGAYADPSGKTGPDITGKDGEYVGITPALESSVGNVCKKAEAGEVDVAIVYSSDVYRFGGVKIVGTIADSTHKSIIYPAAICVDSTYVGEVQDFLEWAITDPAAIKVWQAWGFELIS